MGDMLDYFNSATVSSSFKSSTSILVTDSDDDLTKQIDYNTFISTISASVVGTTGATGPQGATGATGAAGPTGATPTDYVISFNGLTGTVTGVTTGTANTFIPRQNFNSGISSAGASFSSPINGTSAVFSGNVTGVTFIGGLSGNATGIIINATTASTELFPVLCTSTTSTLARADTVAPRVSIIPSTGQLTAPLFRVASTAIGGNYTEINDTGTISTVGNLSLYCPGDVVSIGDYNDEVNGVKLVLDNTVGGSTLGGNGQLNLIGSSVSVSGMLKVPNGISCAGATLSGTINLNGQTFTNLVTSVNGLTGNVTISGGGGGVDEAFVIAMATVL
jgi:hypothetical protein